jgi:hypothetical protein
MRGVFQGQRPACAAARALHTIQIKGVDPASSVEAAGGRTGRAYFGAAGVKPPCTPSAPPVPSPPLTVCAR